MHFTETPLRGAFVIELDSHSDSRGLFARTYCAREFREHGLPELFVQCNTSFNLRKGTLRGMHYQTVPSQESKLVRCTAGAIWDVIVDVRQNSATYRRHFGVELSAVNRRALFVPAEFAHGFQTLQDNTEVFYQMGDYYSPDCSRGIRFDDPKLAIRWPMPVTAISEKDETWPLL